MNKTLASIRDTFQLNMSNLAKLLHVSRPTVYSWLDGKEPTPEAQKSIYSLADIVSKVNALNIMRMDLLIYRPILEGKSLFDQLMVKEDITNSLGILKRLSDKEFSNRQKSAKSMSHNIVSMREVASRNSTPIHGRIRPV